VHDVTSKYILASAMARKTQTPPKSFEDALRELEQILADMEGGQVGLEDSLVKYERGSFLIRHCRSVLSSAEKQIEILNQMPDGSLASEKSDQIADPKAGD
jgi:exodeoxyribonuclease VII small subunit